MPQNAMNSPASGLMAEKLQLQWPASVGVFDQYSQAQKAVDHLADHDFPVENVMIVGTDLRQVERVTGRLSQQKVALGGMASGMWMGLFVGLIFSMLDGQGARSIVTTVLFGALFGLVWALIGYALTRGRRDFTSVSQVVATRYEVLVEHQLLGQAREMLRAEGLLGTASVNRPSSTTRAADSTSATAAPTAQGTPQAQGVPPAPTVPVSQLPPPTGRPHDAPGVTPPPPGGTTQSPGAAPYDQAAPHQDRSGQDDHPQGGATRAGD